MEALDAAARALIEEEETLAARVRRALEEGGARDRERGVRERMSALRTDLAEAPGDDVAAIAAEAQRVRATAAVQERLAPPDPDQPYFAHLQLESERGVRDILLGARTFIDSARGVRIVDWRAAPLAQVFFHFEQGEDYEQDFADRTEEGVVLKRRIVAFEAGELVHIQAPELTSWRDGDGEWHREAGAARPRLEGGDGGALPERIIGTGLAGRKLPVISALLDEAQYDALTRDASQPLLILGGAGCGKTTVALHRLAHLVYQDPDRYRPERLIVIVPEEGLVRLTRSLLDELGMASVRVETVDGWFADQARRRLPELPRKLAEGTPAAVGRLKRHPAFRAQLDAVADEAGRECARALDQRLATGGTLLRAYDASGSQADDAPEARLRAAIAAHADAAGPESAPDRQDEIDRVLARFASPVVDRERLFGDRRLLERVVAAAEGAFSESTIDRTLDWYRRQVAPSADETWADVDPGRRAALDGRGLDAGTPGEVAGSIDVEDIALLLALARAKTGPSSRRGRGQGLAHVILDEAQELSEVECAVLGEAVAGDGCVTVAGDPAQQIGEHAVFRGWEPLMQALGRGRAAPVTLETSYRCTQAIVDFAHAVLGPLAVGTAPEAKREGAPVARSRVPSELHASLLLAEALADLVDREPLAQVAIIAREEDTARRVHDALARQLAVRLVLDGRFAFRPGIDVTTVPQVKGLEFDYVVLPDVSAADYPPDEPSRRMLHVAATRAIHQLWILTSREWSALVPADGSIA